MSNELSVSDVIKTKKLSGMPQTVVRLLELTKNPDIGPNEFVEPILADPGLTGAILKYANSAYFNFAHRISTVKMAVNLLGFKTVCNFVLSTAVRGIIDQPPTELFAISVLWQDSLRRAVFARNFALASQHPAPEEVFTGALLQDLAIPLLIASKPVEYEKILRTARVEKRRIHELEEDAFGWNHAEVGARLCESWNFPPDLVSMIRQHLIPTSTFKETNSERIVTVTAFLPTESSPEWTEQARLEKCIRMLIPNTNPQELYAKTDNDFVQLATAINVSANCRALTRWSAPKAV